jgi:two-component system, probable response regulator PhcQ
MIPTYWGVCAEAFITCEAGVLHDVRRVVFATHIPIMTTETITATVLLVDDEPHVLDALKRALRREPFECLTATSGAAAQELMARHPVDVVISDEQMPGMSGSVLLSLVRKQFPQTIRIILSGQATLEAAVRAINEGEVYRFFLKPCDPADLASTIRQALAHKRLEEQSRRLLREFQKQASLLARLELRSPGLLNVEVDDQGAVMVDESEGDGELEDLLSEMERAMGGHQT